MRSTLPNSRPLPLQCARLQLPMLGSLLCVVLAACSGPPPATPGIQDGAVVVIPTLPVPPPPAPEPDTTGGERGLEFRLLEAEREAPTQQPGAPVGTVALDAARTASLLGRLPALPAETRDSFRFPPASPPPPRTGAVVTQPFPPPDSVAPPAPEPAAAPEALQVVRVTPTGEAGLVPEVVVTFSQPMVPLTTVSALDAAAVPARLTPAAPGRWSWLDTRTLRFEPEGRLPMATTYTVEVPAGVSATTGAALGAPVRVEFTTPTARAVGAYPNRGEAPRPPVVSLTGTRAGHGFVYDPRTVTDLDPLVVVVFDQLVEPAAIVESMVLTADGRQRPIRLATAAEIAADSIVRRITDAAEAGRWVVVRPVGELPGDAEITVSVLPGAPSAEGPRTTEVRQALHFYTYGPLRVTINNCRPAAESPCRPGQSLFLSLNNPIDTLAWTDSFVRVEPAIDDLEIDVRGGMIVMRGDTRPRTTYRVTLDPRIRDQFGQTLEGVREVEFAVGDSPSFLSLPGAPFIVLDPAGPPRLLVHSRGHESLRVRVHRVTPADWPAYAAALQTFQQDPRTEFTPPGQPVVATTLEPAGAPGDFAESAIDLTPALANGLGHAVVVVEQVGEGQGGGEADGRGMQFRAPGIAWVQGTAIGLTAVADGDEMIAWATSLRDGARLAGVQLQLLPTGAAAETGAEGLATLPLTAEPGNLLVARRGADTAILPESPHGWYGQGWSVQSPGGELRWLLFSDRGLYRPGETVTLKGWLRRADLDDGGAPALPTAVQGVRYTVTGPRQEEIGEGTMEPGALGGFHTTFDLPAAINLGGANIRLEATGAGLPEMGRETGHFVRVDEFRRPEYEVTVEAEAGPHFVGGSVPATVRAAYYSGGGLPGSAVEWRATSSAGHFTPPGWEGWSFGRVGWWGQEGRTNQRTLQGTTGPDGEHAVTVALDAVDPPFPANLRLDAQVGDLNRQVGSGGVDLVVHPAALYAGLRASRAWVHPGDTLGIEVVAVTVGGAAAGGRSVEVTAERVEWRWIPFTGQSQESASAPIPVCSVTTAAEPVRCVWRPAEGGSYRLRAEVRDDAGRLSRTQMPVWVAGDQMPPSPDQADPAALSVVPDRPEYQPGDTASILVRSPLHPATGVITIRQTGVVRTESFRMEGATHVLRVPILDDHIPNVHLHVQVVDERTGTGSATGEARLSVPPLPRELEVTVEPADSVLLPGAATAFEVVVRGPDGRPAANAEVALWAVDEAILSLGGYQLPDPLAAFYPERYPNVRDTGLRPFVLLAPRSAGPGTLSGVLVNAASGERLPGAPVALEGTTLQAVSGPNGLFTIEGIAPGTYVLTTTALGSEWRRQVEVPAEGAHLGTLVISAATSGDLMALGGMPPPPPTAPMADGDMVLFSEVEEQVQAESAVSRQAGNAAGSSKAQEPVALRAEFAPLALFEPSLRTDANGRVRVEARLPESLTRYRVMAVAVAGAERFGRGESTVTTRRDLMVRPAPPRFLNFGDRLEIPVVLQNTTDRAMTVEVAARANGILLESPQGQRVTVPARDRVEVRFPAFADSPGTARLQVVAVSGAADDAALVDFPVYTPATAEAFATYGEIDSASPFLLPVSVPGGVLTGFGGLEVTVSSTALQELTDAVLYLESYPFEGAEQIASRVLAIAALRDVLAAFAAEGLPSPDSLVAAVDRDLARLAALQGGDGGWSFWRPDLPSNPYVSAHVTHALQRARENGFTVPAGALDRGLGYLRSTLPGVVERYGPRARVGLRAYALYVRDRAGDAAAVGEALRLIETERAARPLDDLPLEAAGWLLHALADAPTARPAADELLRVIRNRATETAATATFATSYAEEEHLLLHSERRSDAVVLEALIAADPASDLIPKTVRGLLGHRTRGRWAGTQENAWALLALQRYFREYETVTPDFRSRVWLGERFAGEHLFEGRTTERHQVEIPMAEVLRADTAALTLQRAGEGRLYYRAGLRYAPADLELDPLQRGFVVERVYEAVDDSADVTVDAAGDWRIRAGARVRVRVVMTAPSRRHHVALVDPLPAGLEPLNPELQGTGFGEEPPRPFPIGISARPAAGRPMVADMSIIRPGGWYVHQNLRDDRAEAFADLLGAGRYELVYLARATTPGVFVVPPPRAEEMYAPESFGRGATARVIVE